MKRFNIFKKNKSKKRYAIIDIGDRDFEQQVIRRSYKSPVMVDFWASWCGPCRQLGPVLEKIAEESSSEFFLAKLNTEQNRHTAAKYNIHSIPAVKMFRNGQVVGEFSGALPEALVRRFINKSTDGPAPSPANAKNLSPSQKLTQAKQHLKKGRGFEAFALLDQFPESAELEEVEQLRPLAQFLFDMENGDALTGTKSLDDAYLAATLALQKRKPAAALDHLFTALDLGETIDQPHTIAVIHGLFALLGNNHKLTQAYKPKLVV